MLYGLDPSSERFLAALASNGRRMDRAQRQLSTGKRLERASDDPEQVSTMLQSRADLRQTGQLLQNLGRVQAEVDGGEQALQQALKLVERARVLGAQGGNGLQSAENRLSIAGEVKSLIEQVAGLSRSAIAGRFIFSGDSDQTQPFTLDWANPAPLGAYQGTAATRRTEHPSGARFEISRAGDEIFDNPDASKNVFGALNNLRLALEANDSQAILAGVVQVSTASEHLNSEISFYGTVQNQMTEAINATQAAQLRLQTSLSAIEDADPTAAILELNQARYQQQTALASRAQLPRTSLFDYLG
jgi:flagellar hook-associated protein 3 FlgL